MTRSRRFAAALSLAALGAVAAPAIAAETIDVYTVPVATDTYYYVAPARDYYYVAPADDTTYVAPTTEYYYVPSSTVYYAEPGIVVTAPRDEDAAITSDVVDTLANDPRISGRVGVDTYRGNVTLNGRVTTTSQVELAASDARSVEGVRDVSNYLRARVGNE